jgi:hypothetical protein
MCGHSAVLLPYSMRGIESGLLREECGDTLVCTNRKVVHRADHPRVLTGSGIRVLAEAPCRRFLVLARIGSLGETFSSYLISWTGAFKHLEAFSPRLSLAWRFHLSSCQIIDLRFRHDGSGFRVHLPRNDSRISTSCSTHGKERNKRI